MQVPVNLKVKILFAESQIMILDILREEQLQFFLWWSS